ncbi:MAG: hypothetical protein JWM11_180 [Planctomycetaceae bacterium]|nr:hypothetical protein [Planctomycetaceae bacterium]
MLRTSTGDSGADFALPNWLPNIKLRLIEAGRAKILKQIVSSGTRTALHLLHQTTLPVATGGQVMLNGLITRKHLTPIHDIEQTLGHTRFT